MKLSDNQTLVLYLTIILASTCLIWLKKNNFKVIKIKFGNRNVNYINPYWIYIFVCLIPMIFVLSCRYYTGADYEQYTWNYWTVINESSYNQLSIFNIEPLYTLTIKISDFIVPSVPQFWFALMSIIMFVNIIIAIKIFEVKNIAEFVLLFGLFSYLHCFNYVRQMVAASIIMVAVGILLKKEKVVPFIILIILSTLIHRSSIIFILLWPIYYIKKEKTLFYRVLVIISPLYISGIVRVIKYIPFLKRYAGYFTGSIQFGVGFLIEIIPLALVLIISQFSIKDEDRVKNTLVNAGWLAVPFRFMSYYAYGAGRLFITCAFFAIFAYCLSRKKIFTKCVICVAFLIYFILEFYVLNNSEVFPYQFCF